MAVEYYTKRVAPNNTVYHFSLHRHGSSFMTVTRERKWYQPNEILLQRTMYENLEALKFFQSLLDSFPRDQLYKE